MARRPHTLYRMEWFGEDGSNLFWAERRGDAVAKRRELGIKPASAAVVKVEIPRDRAGLVSWLNRNFQTDNG